MAGRWLPNPDLKPEKIRTMEAIWEQRLSRGVYGTVSLYNSDFSESIDLENKRDEEGIENLHPPVYHIVRVIRRLTQKDDLHKRRMQNATRSSFPQRIY
jgi:outer membrane cobalamin receptor